MSTGDNGSEEQRISREDTKIRRRKKRGFLNSLLRQGYEGQGGRRRKAHVYARGRVFWRFRE
jgi:hypothetical protein